MVNNDLDSRHLVQVVTTPGAMLTLALLALATYCGYQFWLSPLAGIPGPLSARLGLYGWQTVRALKLDIGPSLKRWHDKTGSPLIRINSNQVSICDPKAIPVIFKNFDKTGFYHMFTFTNVPTMMSTLGHQDHKRQIKSDSPLFSKQNLLGLEPIFDDVVEALMGCIRREYEQGNRTLDFARLLRYYTLDQIGEVAFGESFKTLDTNTDPDNMLDRIDKAIYGITLGGIHPRLAPPLLKIARRFNLADINFVRNRAATGLHRSVERQKAGTGRNDLMARILELVHCESGRPYTQEEMEGMACIFFAAGTDTSAIVLRSFVYFMLKHPECLAALRKELDQAVADGRLSIPPTYEQTLRLPYFQASLWETIRMYPSSPWPLPRVVPKGGVVICGKYFPEGTEVAMSPYVLHHDTRAFGPTCSTFDPSRWLNLDSVEMSKMKAKVISFGSGARVCMGKTLGLMAVSKALPPLLLQYDLAFTPRSPSSPHKYKMGKDIFGNETVDEPWITTSGFLAGQFDFWLDVSERHK